MNDERVLSSASRLRESLICLVPPVSEVVTATWKGLQDLIKEAVRSSLVHASSGAMALADTAIVISFAAGSVTV